MVSPLDVLEERVLSAAKLIASLRADTVRLEKDLASRSSPMAVNTLSLPTARDPELIREIEHLRAERALVRARIHDLIKEIDRVT